MQECPQTFAKFRSQNSIESVALAEPAEPRGCNRSLVRGDHPNANKPL
jgi:hypothetical protein